MGYLSARQFKAKVDPLLLSLRQVSHFFPKITAALLIREGLLAGTLCRALRIDQLGIVPQQNCCCGPLRAPLQNCRCPLCRFERL